MDNLIPAHLGSGGIPLDIMAMAQVNRAFQNRGQIMSEAESAALSGRIRVAIRHGLREAKAIAIEALQAEGWPARFEVRGDLGLVTIRPQVQ